MAAEADASGHTERSKDEDFITALAIGRQVRPTGKDTTGKRKDEDTTGKGDDEDTIGKGPGKNVYQGKAWPQVDYLDKYGNVGRGFVKDPEAYFANLSMLRAKAGKQLRTDAGGLQPAAVANRRLLDAAVAAVVAQHPKPSKKRPRGSIAEELEPFLQQTPAWPAEAASTSSGAAPSAALVPVGRKRRLKPFLQQTPRIREAWPAEAASSSSGAAPSAALVPVGRKRRISPQMVDASDFDDADAPSFQDNAGQVDRSSIVVSPVDSPTDSRNCTWRADGFTDEEPASEPEPSSY